MSRPAPRALVALLAALLAIAGVVVATPAGADAVGATPMIVTIPAHHTSTPIPMPDGYTYTTDSLNAVPDGASIVYTPVGAPVNAQFDYTATDVNGVQSTSTITISVNVAPTAQPMTLAVPAHAADTPFQLPGSGNGTLTYSTTSTDVTTDGSAAATFHTSADPQPTSFDYTVTDPYGDTATNTVTVDVNTPPVAMPVVATVPFHVTTTPILLPAQAPGVTYAASGAQHGSLVVDQATHAVRYTPSGADAEPDSFAYTVTDGYGDVGTNTVTVNVNTPPTAADLPVTIASRLTGSKIQLPQSDADLTYSVSNGTNGTVSVDPRSGVAVYTPNAAPAQPDSFDYTVTDSSGDTATGHVTVSVAAGPAAPDLSYTIPSRQTATPITLPSGGAGATYSVTNGAHGTVSAIDSARSFTYTPSGATAVGDTLRYTIINSYGDSATGAITLAVNAGPTANPLTVTVPDHAATTPIKLPGSGTGTLHYSTSLTGDLAGDTVAYTTDSNPSAAQFSYTVTDDFGDWATGTVNVVVNTPPVALPVTVTVPYRTGTCSITLSGSWHKGEVFSSASTRIASPIPQNVATYTTGSAVAGSTSTFDYTITDSFGDTATNTVTVTVNTPPKAQPVAVTVAHHAMTTPITLLGSGGSALTYTANSTATKVTGAVAAYTTTANPTPTIFWYTVTDKYLDTATNKVSVSINNPPAVVDTTLDTAYRTAVSGLVNVSPDATSFALVSAPAGSTAQLSASDGRFTWTPPASFAGTAKFTYTAADAYADSTPGAIYVTVAKAPTTLTLNVSAGRLLTTTSIVANAVVTSAGDETAGDVTFGTGTANTAVRVAQGHAALTLGRYPGGSHTITAHFGGTGTAATSATLHVTFAVTRVVSALSFTTNPTQLTSKTTNAHATIRIRAAIVAGSGTVKIVDSNGARTLATGTVRNGVAVLTLPKLSLGQHNLAVSFTGTPWVAPSSTTVVERVPIG